ncbi:MAG: MBL fold metallo-hydrolase [Oscillospiraceae bacterium]|nr:MBL fold metallo-hydrolase [Oscillospiraceae bacterium]
MFSSQPDIDYNNTVTMLDVGQAACTLIESDSQFCMIDAGKYGGHTDIVAYLHSRGIKKINLLVLTHFHYDHTSEALDVIRNFDIGTVLIPNLSPENIPDSYLYKSLEADAANGYYDIAYASRGMEFTIGQGTLKVIDDTFNSENINNTSVVTSFTVDDFIYVNTADTETDRERYLLEYMPEDVDFLTAGHHGSQDSTSQRLLDRLKPAFVGISCGKDNDYGHPHANMLKRLDNMNIPYAITYETGNIVYSVATQSLITE